MPRPREGRLRMWALGLCLSVALGSVGVLVFQAVGLERSQRAVAERVLQDYSTFAADQFSRLADERLGTLIRSILEPVACQSSVAARSQAAVEHSVRSTAATAASCARTGAVHGFFEIDPVTLEVLFSTGSIAASIREAASSLPSDGPVAFRVLSNSGLPLVAGYWTAGVPGGGNRVIGFVAPAALVQSVFDDIVNTERLLPGSLTQPAHNRDYLNIDIRTTDGISVYRSGVEVPLFANDRAVGSLAANLQVRVAISGTAADRLIIGGVPRSRLPMLLALLSVSISLLTIGAWQMYREQRLARMRVDFVRHASHELRTPLAQIRLFTDTLQLGRVRSWSEVIHSMAFIDQQTRRLARLVENLLVFAQRGNRRRAALEPIELGAFLEETALAFHPIAQAHGQALRVESTQGCAVVADRDWLTQIVLNLLDNAAKYGPQGQTITLRVELDSRHARVMVDDEGPGVPPSRRKQIFAPFVRLSREHEQRTGGTGIGLAVAADLAAAMQARIWAAASPNGARFIVEIPVSGPGGASHAHGREATGSASQNVHSNVA